MCALLPLAAKDWTKALLGITCSCIIIARAKRRNNKSAAHSSAPPPRSITEDCRRDSWADEPGGIAVKANATSAAAAVEHLQPLTSLVKLLTSVRAYRLLERSLKSMWLVLAIMGAAVFRTWAESLPQVQFADAHHAIRPAVQIDTVKSFCGTWVKDTMRSESMDGFCDLFGVPHFLRQAARLIIALELSMVGDSLIVTQVCRVGFMSTTECYPLDGVHSRAHKRRDMRPGKQLGKLSYAAEGQMQLQVSFHGRLPGEALDTLQLQEDGQTLVVQHNAFLHGKGSAKFKEVYQRSYRQNRKAED